MTGFWKSWMRVWCWATLAFGAMFAAAGLQGFETPTRAFYDVIYWPIDGQSPYGPDVRLTASLLGAVMIGWAIALLGLVAASDRAGPAPWRAMSLSVAVWYVVDSLASVLNGAPVNAISNTLFAAPFFAAVFISGVLQEGGSGSGASGASARP